jgi:hypothetical protein
MGWVEVSHDDKRSVMVYLYRAFSKCESYMRQLCRAYEASKEGPKDMNLETRPNDAKFVHPTTVVTPRPTQIFGGAVKQMRSKLAASHASDCVNLPHIKCNVYKLFLSWRNSPYWARASWLSMLHDHTQTHHTGYVSGRVISWTQSLRPPQLFPLTGSAPRVAIRCTMTW